MREPAIPDALAPGVHGAVMLAALSRHLPAGAFTTRPATGGIYLWGRLGDGLDARELLQAATELINDASAGVLDALTGNAAHVRNYRQIL